MCPKIKLLGLGRQERMVFSYKINYREDMQVAQNFMFTKRLLGWAGITQWMTLWTSECSTERLEGLESLLGSFNFDSKFNSYHSWINLRATCKPELMLYAQGYLLKVELIVWAFIIFQLMAECCLIAGIYGTIKQKWGPLYLLFLVILITKMLEAHGHMTKPGSISYTRITQGLPRLEYPMMMIVGSLLIMTIALLSGDVPHPSTITSVPKSIFLQGTQALQGQVIRYIVKQVHFHFVSAQIKPNTTNINQYSKQLTPNQLSLQSVYLHFFLSPPIIPHLHLLSIDAS